VSVRSFVVRALLERDDAAGADVATWHGFVTDTQTGERRTWHRTSDLVRFIERHLVPPVIRGRVERTAMTSPTLTEVVDEMLDHLRARLRAPIPALPEPNVTLERVTERLVGLGNHRGDEPSGNLGIRTLRGGRLDARVRFQLWGGTVPIADNAVGVLHTDLLDDRDELRAVGFLRMNAVETTLAERVESVGGWRKATSYDVLYEYTYLDSDDADSLITKIRVTTDPEQAGSPDREQQDMLDEIVRWDETVAPVLVVRGPVAVGRLSALVFTPGPALGGSVVVARTNGAGPITQLPDLESFLVATSGPAGLTNAEVTLTPADLFTALGDAGTGLSLGDWDADGTPDVYTGFERRLDPVIELSGGDRLTISYLPPPGPGIGLDQTAVVYLRVNAP
jgi:hypothetical protein